MLLTMLGGGLFMVAGLLLLQLTFTQNMGLMSVLVGYEIWKVTRYAALHGKGKVK